MTMVPALMALAFIAVPIAEIWLIIQVGQTIGAWQTVVALVAISILGAWLVRREGRRTWAALSEAIREGRAPARELSDAGLVIVGGTLLLTPGFLTDLVGLFFLVPITRPLARRLLLNVIARRINRATMRYDVRLLDERLASDEPRARRQRNNPYGHAGGGDVIQGEVVDDE
jgi:UPF0716 protein FxsA